MDALSKGWYKWNTYASKDEYTKSIIISYVKGSKEKVLKIFSNSIGSSIIIEETLIIREAIDIIIMTKTSLWERID